MSTFIKILIFALISPAFAATTESGTSPEPLAFQAWKDQQVLEAQNQVLRIAGRSTSAPAKGKSAKLDNSARDLKRAQESLDASNGLQFDDYINIYLPTLQDQPEVFHQLVEKLSKDELAEIVKTLVKKNAKPIDAKRNTPGLTAAARPSSN